MSENFSDSKIGSRSSLMSSVQPSLLMDTASSRPGDNETTCDTGNISCCSNQEELWNSMDTAQSITPRYCFSGDTFCVETITEEEDIWKEVNITQEEALNEQDNISQETTITQEESVIGEVTINQEEDITQEATITQEEDMAHEGTITLEMTMNQLATLTQEDSITKGEAITPGQPEDADPASSRNQRGPSWKGVKKIMVNGLRHLCSCPTAAKRSHDSSKTLAPKKQDPAVTHRTRLHQVVQPPDMGSLCN
ncbi:sperm motility kinase X-like protein [Cricetulus griseus]|uniref:Sperm motility kinase X-like protein n=1 Tax=Cricetulus griseus TaxID=10029 RepID=A0A061HZN7_CRIGR|nr:sperm motility kinase X-like protein [Cricetulus griseus]